MVVFKVWNYSDGVHKTKKKNCKLKTCFFLEQTSHVNTYMIKLDCRRINDNHRCVINIVFFKWIGFSTLQYVTICCISYTCVLTIESIKGLNFFFDFMFNSTIVKWYSRKQTEMMLFSISQGSKFKTNQYRKIRLQFFDIWCKNARQMC